MAEASGVQKFENGYRDFMNSSSYGTRRDDFMQSIKVQKNHFGAWWS